MRSDSVNPAVIQHKDHISILYRGDALRNNNLGGIRNLLAERAADKSVRFCINRTGGIIENQNFRLFQQCARNA